MKKDTKWLKEEIMNLYPNHSEMYEHPDYLTVEKVDLINNFIDLINQLDEPETLSQKWIDENKVARINNVRKMTTSDVVTVEKLKNLIVPKQDKQEVEENFYTFDNAKKWLHDNGFVVFEKDKLDEEVQRMVDETYEATNEKPVIPQFVADYIEQSKKDNDSINQVFEFIDAKENKELWNWLFPSISDEKRTNQETFMRAWLAWPNVQVEKQIKCKVCRHIFVDDENYLKTDSGNLLCETCFFSYAVSALEATECKAGRKDPENGHTRLVR